MAHADSFDTASPGGAEDISLGDDTIRKLARALDQRLGSFFSNWPDGDPIRAVNNGDGATVQTKGRVVYTDDVDGEDPAALGHQTLWFNPRTGKLFIGLSDNTPKAVSADLTVIDYGLEADLPNPAETAFYYATDTGELFFNNEGTFESISATATKKYRLYAKDQGPFYADGGNLNGFPEIYCVVGATGPTDNKLFFLPSLPRPSKITKFRMYTVSGQTTGDNGIVNADLKVGTRAEAIDGFFATAVLANLINQSGDNTWKMTESPDLDRTLVDDDVIFVEVTLELLANNEIDDAGFLYIEFDYEEL